ncbi:hypothetical protein STEG23_023722 [Scotinomys teguina]
MAARGTCPAPTRRLLVLLLLPLLWAPIGVRAGPDEDLSHRNQEPPAPAQQLQPQPAAVQGLEPARAEKGLTPAAPVHTNKEAAATQTNLGFIHAFVAAISVIIVSELGDKTFFIAAIMAMRSNRLTVLAGAMLALALMTCLSVLFGYATTVIPRVYTYYVSTALFAIFGIRMLREGLKMSPDEGQEELEEVQAELKKKDEEKLLLEECSLNADRLKRFRFQSITLAIEMNNRRQMDLHQNAQVCGSRQGQSAVHRNQGAERQIVLTSVAQHSFPYGQQN